MSFQAEEVSHSTIFARVFAKNRLLLALTTAHFAIAYILSLIFQQPFAFQALPLVLMFVQVLIPLFVIFLWLWRFAWLIFIRKPEHPLEFFITDIRGFVFDVERLLSGFFAMLLISVFASTFIILKDLIPVMQMFAWDPQFAALDRTVHGGTDPYILLMPLLGTPYATTFINLVYNLWFVVLYFVVFMASFDRTHTVRRNTLLISFVLIFTIGGNLLATVFSSAGPVYYQYFDYGDHFLPLLETLKNFSGISPVWALDTHELLLDGYINNGPMKGISAMPSMHVAIAVMLAIYGFHCSRWAGWLLAVFALLIQLGSVHLAWHYAIDGYAGAVIAIGCWMISAKLAKRF
jgi:hypothetical protein